MKSVLCIVFLVGCGEPFTTTPGVISTDSRGTVVETGGAENDGGSAGTGGATGSGGAEIGGRAVSSTGGAPATGGRSETGGASTGGRPETGGVSSTGGAPETDACVLVTHDNGLGQHWTDCAPLGTYDVTEATKACKASGASVCLFGACNGAMVCNSANYGTCWVYSGLSAGYVGTVTIGGTCLGADNGHPWQ